MDDDDGENELYGPVPEHGDLLVTWLFGVCLLLLGVERDRLYIEHRQPSNTLADLLSLPSLYLWTIGAIAVYWWFLFALSLVPPFFSPRFSRSCFPFYLFIFFLFNFFLWFSFLFFPGYLQVDLLSCSRYVAAPFCLFSLNVWKQKKTEKKKTLLIQEFCVCRLAPVTCMAVNQMFSHQAKGGRWAEWMGSGRLVSSSTCRHRFAAGTWPTWWVAAIWWASPCCAARFETMQVVKARKIFWNNESPRQRVSLCNSKFIIQRVFWLSAFQLLHIDKRKLTKTSYCIRMMWQPLKLVGGKGGTYSCSFLQSSVSPALILPRFNEASSRVSVCTTRFFAMYWIV